MKRKIARQDGREKFIDELSFIFIYRAAPPPIGARPEQTGFRKFEPANQQEFGC